MKVILKNPGPNINGNIYTSECLEKIANSLKDKELIGENNPPFKKINPCETIKRMSTIDLSNAACKIKNIRYKDGNIVGDIKILDDNIKQLIDEGLSYSFGLRGIGEISKDKLVDPVTFQVITFDLITDPDLIWPPLIKDN